MKKISTKTKATLCVVGVIFLVLSIPIGNILIRNHKITNELTSIAQSHGLKDVKIIIGSKIPDYDFYNVTVECSNLESLSYFQMYSLDNDMHADDAYVSEYKCNGNTYKIYPYTKSIYKNGTEIHDDYWNSQSHKDATKDDEEKKDYTSSYRDSSSYSFTPYKSPSKEDNDPYNAKDYAHAEDFYYDHYDDFFDYYDAEDYYNEHND